MSFSAIYWLGQMPILSSAPKRTEAMFETLIASGLCYYLNAQGQMIELNHLCAEPSAPIRQTSYTAAEIAYLETYRQQHPDSFFTDAEVLFSGRVSCGDGATIVSEASSGTGVSYHHEDELATMLMEHWEASHTAALTYLCPELRNLQVPY